MVTPFLSCAPVDNSAEIRNGIINLVFEGYCSKRHQLSIVTISEVLCKLSFFFLKCQLKTCNTILDKIFLNTMRRDLLNNVLILWAGIFLLNIL